MIGGIEIHTVVADPPWPGPVGDWRSKPLVVREHSLRVHGRKAPSNVYPLLSLDQIAFHKPETAPLAHLWLWSLPQHVDWAWDTSCRWGFEPVHLLAWCKPGFGTGGFQANTEYVVLARKGGPTKNAFGRMRGTHFGWDRTSRHSTKPEDFFTLVESVSPGPYLEMYARQRRPGWSSWGNELDGIVPV